ncbi:MAG: hypothetical protein FJ272_12385 [Planctomycetes bacterium]|nr:hypothetical protein [Planctomycetota bacterium]
MEKPLAHEGGPGRPDLLIVAPSDPSRSRKLAARMVDLGVFFPFELPYRLPERLPADLAGFRFIVIPADKAAADRARLEAFARQGGGVLRMEDADWESESLIERIPTQGGLRLGSPAMAARMEAAPDRLVLDATLRWSMAYERPEWHDVLRYNIECLAEAFELTGDRAILDQAGRLVHKALATGAPPPASCDHVACTYAMLHYMALAQEPTLLGVCRSVVDDYLRLAPRYRGVLSNFLRRDSNGIARAEIAFQACPALARLARHTKEQRYADTAVEQILLLDGELSDAATGLWFLGRGAGGRTPLLWGRGCAFSLRGVVDTLAELDAARADRAGLLAILKRMADALRKLQGPDGDWRQIMNEPQSRPESSATAWTVAALAKASRLGWLGPEFRPCIEQGWRAVKRRVWDGLATRICGGVTASMDPEYYRSRPFLAPSYGHFALLAAIEVARLSQRPAAPSAP